MARLELTCDTCGVSRALTSPEVEELVAAFRKGEGEGLRCPTCGTNMSRPLQRALDLPSPQTPQSSEIRARRWHVRLPLDLPVAYQRPGGERGWGRVKNLSDGGLLLHACEALPPSTSLRLQLHGHQRVHTLEGVVVWNDGGPEGGGSPVAHGVRFTSPVAEGFAVGLFLSESSFSQG